MSDDSGRRTLSSPVHARAHGVAEKLWAHAERQAAPSGSVDDTVDALLAVLDVGLRRWIGAEGYAVLLSRAAAETLPSQPALAAIDDVVPKPPKAGKSMDFTAAETQAAMVALLVAMMRQLGGIIGEDMAIRLVEMSGTPSLRGIASTETNDSPS